MVNQLVEFIKSIYNTQESIPLHRPLFNGNEIKYLTDTIDSTFVSSIGNYVEQFENNICQYTNSKYGFATVNGTAALHSALLLSNVCATDLVITQALTFVATCNAISYLNADPIFIDVDEDTLGLSPVALEKWLNEFAYLDDKNLCRTKNDNKIIRACVPMHTFGHACKIDEIIKICTNWQISVIEDAAEALGSTYHNKHLGTFGACGVLSFNGNKIITTGGGGMLITHNKELMIRGKHITTTSKKPHAYEFNHTEIGYNYRLPNLNAALGCAQLEQIEFFIRKKRRLAKQYFNFFLNQPVKFFSEPKNSRSNYWLNAVVCSSKEQRDELLIQTNSNGVLTRPPWTLMNKLPMFKNATNDGLKNSKRLADTLLNLPSSVPK